MKTVKGSLFTIGKYKIYPWMIFLVIVTSFITWFVAETLTPGFTTETYLSGFHINHSFIGVALILFSFLLKKKIPSLMFVIVLTVGFTMIVHDGVIFRELTILRD